MSKKLLVTGAAGFLGWHVSQFAPVDWRVIGTWHRSSAGLFPKSEAIHLDLTDKDATWQAIKATSPDAIFHLAAASSPAFCEANQEKTRDVNVVATAQLAEFCAERRIKLVFTSSSQVYDGTTVPCREHPAPSPKNEYGRQKLEAEKCVAEILPLAAIVRIAVMYGKAGPGNQNFLGQWLDKWRQGEAVTAFHDEIRSFMSGRAAASGLFCLLENAAEGIFNLGGKIAMSRLAFAELVKAVYQLPNASIISKSQQEVDAGVFRPADLTMDLEKITGIGYQPKHPLEELKALAG